MCVTSSSVITHHELAISYPLLHSSIPIRCVVDSVVTLLLLLGGEEAVTALPTIMECVPCVSQLMRREWRMERYANDHDLINNRCTRS